MTLDYNASVEVKMDMRTYVKYMIDEFPVNIEKSQTVTSLSTGNLFQVDRNKPLNNSRANCFHKYVARCLFLCKRSRPDIQPIIAVLCTIVKHTTRGYWNKLLILMKHLVGNQKLCLTLRAYKSSFQNGM